MELCSSGKNIIEQTACMLSNPATDKQFTIYSGSSLFTVSESAYDRQQITRQLIMIVIPLHGVTCMYA